VLGVLEEGVVNVALIARRIERGPVVLVQRRVELPPLEQVRVRECPAPHGYLRTRDSHRAKYLVQQSHVLQLPIFTGSQASAKAACHMA
jgi:hypothetical protein